MKIINKIAILISWPREIDMFSSFTENILDDVVFIVDDFFYYTQDEKHENAKNIVELLNDEMDYVLLSKVLGKLKYKILLSTAQTLQEKVTYGSYLKYIYAIYIGSFIYDSGLSEFFMKKTGHSLTGGGKDARKFGRYHIEKVIGKKVIKYPKGLDISKTNYPDKKWKNIFDVYFCHSKIDHGLITNKFSDAKCINIGYPRYDRILPIKCAKKNIFSEIHGINILKPTLLWMSTLIRFKGELTDNIGVWAPTIIKLLDEFNIIIRPHPKVVVIDPEIVNNLTELGFLVDVKKNRNLGELYQSVDLVLADYGGSVLSSVYMKKKLILLNMSSEYTHMRKKRMYIDDDVRRYVRSFNIDNRLALVEQVKNDIKDNNKLKIERLKKIFFGDECDHENIKQLSYGLVKELAAD
ncbi:hypothetical protein HOL24_04580 [bacterium]|jgi:hypothetical protein|nr:hypothetical protein [bacterium]